MKCDICDEPLKRTDALLAGVKQGGSEGEVRRSGRIIGRRVVARG